MRETIKSAVLGGWHVLISIVAAWASVLHLIDWERLVVGEAVFFALVLILSVLAVVVWLMYVWGVYKEERR